MLQILGSSGIWSRCPSWESCGWVITLVVARRITDRVCWRFCRSCLNLIILVRYPWFSWSIEPLCHVSHTRLPLSSSPYQFLIFLVSLSVQQYSIPVSVVKENLNELEAKKKKVIKGLKFYWNLVLFKSRQLKSKTAVLPQTRDFYALYRNAPPANWFLLSPS